MGAFGFILATTTTGVLGSVVTKVTGNAIDSSRIILTIHQYPIQQFFRRTVIQYIGTSLDGVICSLRTNTPLFLRNQVFFDVGDEFCFQGVDAKERRRMFFDFSFRVVPVAGTRPRPLNDSIPAPDLPDYDRHSTRTLVTGDNKGLLDGTGKAVIEGALFGVAGGALARVAPALAGAHPVPIVPGKVGIILGMSSATGVAVPVKNLAFPSTEPDRATLFVEFATEAQHHVNRLARCAVENSVGLEIIMRIGSTTDTTARVNPTGAIGAQNCQFYWSVNEEINLP